MGSISSSRSGRPLARQAKSGPHTSDIIQRRGKRKINQNSLNNLKLGMSPEARAKAIANRQHPYLTTILRRLLKEPIDSNDPNSMTRGDRLMQIGMEAAENSNYPFFKEMLERSDGKVAIKVEANVQHEPLQELNDDDLASIIGGNGHSKPNGLKILEPDFGER